MQPIFKWQKIPVFSEQWFKFWQKPLLFVLNCVPVMGHDLRQALGIPPEYDRAWLTKLLPNCFHCYNGAGKRVAVFYSRQPLADNLRKNYADLWKLFHSWDMGFANKYCPAFNVGFDTLTAYTNTTDYRMAYIGNSNNSFATCRNASTGTVGDNSHIALWSLRDGTPYVIKRGFCSFNTSSLLSSSIISDVTLSFFVIKYSEANSGYATIHIVSSTFDCTRSVSSVWTDFGAVGSTSFANLTWGNMTHVSTNIWTLDANGIANINKGGTSKFGVRFASDLLGWTPTGGNSAMLDTPCLTVTYTVAAKGNQTIV